MLLLVSLRLIARIFLEILNYSPDRRLFCHLRLGLFVLVVGGLSPSLVLADYNATYRAMWHTVNREPGGAYASSPLAACKIQHDAYAPTAPDLEYHNISNSWVAKQCDWCIHSEGCEFNIGPTIVTLNCVDEAGEPAYAASRVPPQDCKVQSQISRPVCQKSGAKPADQTEGNPVIISSGTKIEFATDFASADGLMRVSRVYRSDYGLPKGEVVLNKGLGLNWRPDFMWDLKLGSTFKFSRGFTIVRPDGAVYGYWFKAGVITKESFSPPGLNVLLVSPAVFDADDILDNGATFEVTDERGRVITLELYRVGTDKYSRARVMEIKQPAGYTLTFAYATANELTTITDSYGRQFTFTWVKYPQATGGPEVPLAISSIQLPDGNSLHYSYDGPSGLRPAEKNYERLVKVETKDGGGVVVDSVTYYHEDVNRPYALTYSHRADEVLHYRI